MKVLKPVAYACGFLLPLAGLVWTGSRAAGRSSRVERRVVVAKHALRRFAAITAADVEIRGKPLRKGDTDYANDAAAVVTKLVAAAVDRSAVVRPSDLLDPELLAGRNVVTVNAVLSSDAPRGGALADIFVSPRQPGDPQGHHNRLEPRRQLILRRVPVLAVLRQTDKLTVTLAIAVSDQDGLTALLGYSDVRVSPSS